MLYIDGDLYRHDQNKRLVRICPNLSSQQQLYCIYDSLYLSSVATIHSFNHHIYVPSWCVWTTSNVEGKHWHWLPNKTVKQNKKKACGFLFFPFQAAEKWVLNNKKNVQPQLPQTQCQWNLRSLRGSKLRLLHLLRTSPKHQWFLLLTLIFWRLPQSKNR